MEYEAEEWKEKGNEAMKGEKYTEAMLYYSNAIKIDNDNPAYFSNRSKAWLQMQQYYFALVDAKEVIKRMPKWPKGHFRRGEVEMATEHYEEAMQSFKKALETDPDDSTLKLSLEKATTLCKKQKKWEGRVPWLGGMFGMGVTLFLILADEHIAGNKAILQSDLVRFIAVTAVTFICYGMGVFYRLFQQNARCSYFDPPVELTPEDMVNMGIRSDSEVKSQPTRSSESQKTSDQKSGARQRKKGRS